ncbi:MAG TPA: hypothetical protein PKJ28_00665 [Bacteroidales bacterium]|nr:hypothetical protein [Bacteroidales bacterium]HPS73322.1 hypothetical protein [Bacteroidales bacterium]
MKYKALTPRFFIVFSVILVAALLRLLPHWPNFTPIAAMALFAGTYFDRKHYAFAIPITAMFISDLVIGLHANMPAVYLSFAVTVLVGMAIRKKVSVRNIALASIGSSVIFFLVTNFAAWLASPFYPQTILGLAESYIAGLAFFNDAANGISFFMNDVVGTLFYSSVFYGAFYLAQMRFPVLDRSRF